MNHLLKLTLQISALLLFIFALTTCDKEYGCQSCVHKLKGSIKWKNSLDYFIDNNITTVSIYLDEYVVVKDADVILYDSETDLICNNGYWFDYSYTVVKSYGDVYDAHLKFVDQDQNTLYSNVVELPLDKCNRHEITLQ